MFNPLFDVFDFASLFCFFGPVGWAGPWGPSGMRHQRRTASTRSVHEQSGTDLHGLSNSFECTFVSTFFSHGSCVSPRRCICGRQRRESTNRERLNV